jgi:hypothetical protein
MRKRTIRRRQMNPVAKKIVSSVKGLFKSKKRRK